MKSDQQLVRELMNFLEDRRVLFNSYDSEILYYAVGSVQEIRKFLSEQINHTQPYSELESEFKLMRAACRKFLDATQSVDNGPHHDNSTFYLALGGFRDVVGVYLAAIAERYGWYIGGQLRVILPAEDAGK